MEKSYDISFLSEYIKVKGIKVSRFCKILNISRAHLLRLLRYKEISSKSLSKILEYFKVDSYEELKELVNKELNIYNEEEINIDKETFKKFMKKNHIKNFKLIEYLEISRPNFYRLCKNSEILLNKRLTIKLYPLLKSENPKKFLDEQIIKNRQQRLAEEEIIESNINSYKELFEKTGFDISFLKDYLKIKGIYISNLSSSLNIKRNELDKLLNGEDLASLDLLKKILEILKINNYEELKKIASNELNSYKENSSSIKIDPNSLKKFIEDNQITYINLAKYLNVSRSSVYKLCKEEIPLKERFLSKLYPLVSSDNPKEYLRKQLSSINVTNIKGAIYDITFLKDYLEESNIQQSLIAKTLNVSRQYISFILNKQDLITLSQLKPFLTFFGLNSYEELQEMCLNKEQKKLTLTY